MHVWGWSTRGDAVLKFHKHENDSTSVAVKYWTIPERIAMKKIHFFCSFVLLWIQMCKLHVYCAPICASISADAMQNNRHHSKTEKIVCIFYITRHLLETRLTFSHFFSRQIRLSIECVFLSFVLSYLLQFTLFIYRRRGILNTVLRCRFLVPIFAWS